MRRMWGAWRAAREAVPGRPCTPTNTEAPPSASTYVPTVVAPTAAPGAHRPGTRHVPPPGAQGGVMVIWRGWWLLGMAALPQHFVGRLPWVQRQKRWHPAVPLEQLPCTAPTQPAGPGQAAEAQRGQRGRGLRRLGDAGVSAGRCHRSAMGMCRRGQPCVVLPSAVSVATGSTCITTNMCGAPCLPRFFLLQRHRGPVAAVRRHAGAAAGPGVCKRHGALHGAAGGPLLRFYPICFCTFCRMDWGYLNGVLCLGFNGSG